MELFLSAPDQENIMIRLSKNGRQIGMQKIKAKRRQAEVFLPAIDRLLSRYQAKIQDVRLIEVDNSGESFTGIRLAVSIANALAYGAGIEVKALGGGTIKARNYSLALPAYRRPPKISLAKTP